MAVRNNINRRGKGAHPSSLAMPAPQRGTGTVRIVSGRWRRSIIQVCAAEGLRPTSERVRETVFDWIAHLFGTIEGIRVLDLFAGSGAMGFEAASRGAQRVDWTDINRAGIAAIRTTLAKLGAKEGFTAHVTDAFRFLNASPDLYDLIVIDPPFAADLQKRAVEASLVRLAPEGLLYVESPVERLPDDVIESFGLVRVRSGSAGAVRFELLARAGTPMAAQAKLSKEEKRNRKA